MNKPVYTLTDYFKYLDQLRMSVQTNMLGAGRFLQDNFGIEKREANEVLSQWMRTFKEGVSPEKRAKEAEVHS